MSKPPRSTKVPSGRLSRLASFGGLAGSLAGNVLKNTAKQVLSGEAPTLTQNLLNQDNALSITNKLAHMRGAAMKVGQLLSMDAGDLLPKEWEPILSRLRQQAHAMPKPQLLKMLNDAWGEAWHEKFSYFSFEPIAAASIGQVHKAVLSNGQTLAIKVQYPGVKQSIDSDIDNVVSLIKLSGAIPKHVDLGPLLTKAKRQLHEEADYRQEAEYMRSYQEVIKGSDVFSMPSVINELSTDKVLAMTYLQGEAIESLHNQKQIDFVIDELLKHTLDELFVHKITQSDPNFANFLYNPDTNKILLLDFGATRTISDQISANYLTLAKALQDQNLTDIEAQLFKLGLVDKHMSASSISLILDACLLASESLQCDAYNFKHQEIVSRLQQITQPLIENREATATPDFDIALINRKVTGIVLLANRLGATVNLRSALNKQRA